MTGQRTGPIFQSSASKSDTNHQLNSLHFEMEKLPNAPAATRPCPPVTSTSTTLGTALPATSMVATPRSTDKPSGQLTMDPDMIPHQQVLYFSVSITFYDHQDLIHFGRLWWVWKQCDTILGLLHACSCLAVSSTG